MNPEKDEKLERLKFLWEEYSYRHEHSWKVVFQTTTAVVVLSVIPYLQTNVTEGLDYVILIMPGLAILTAFFAYWVMMNELDVFYDVKILYHELQDEVYQLSHKPDRPLWKLLFFFPERKGKKLEKAVKDGNGGKDEPVHKSNFKNLVQIYFLCLFLIASVNTFAIYYWWIPHVRQEKADKKNRDKTENSEQTVNK